MLIIWLNNQYMKRIIWIDWMKTIGIFLIVYGHFFSVWCHYIYVFSVPLFFAISGFLCSRDENKLVFWKKLIYNLVVPIFIICFLNLFFQSMIDLYRNDWHYTNYIRFVRNIFLGIHGGYYGLCNMWFVYSLAIIKIIHYYSKKRIIDVLFVILSVGGAILYNEMDSNLFFKQPNAIANIFVAYPFFIFGNIMRSGKSILCKDLSKVVLFVIFTISILGVCISGLYNDDVWMHKCGYGNSMLLFLLGGVAGTVLVFVISKSIPFFSSIIVTISKGTIIILGFQWYFINIILAFLPCKFIVYLVSSIVIVILFVPIIRFLECNCPIMLGRYRSK